MVATSVLRRLEGVVFACNNTLVDILPCCTVLTGSKTLPGVSALGTQCCAVASEPGPHTPDCPRICRRTTGLERAQGIGRLLSEGILWRCSCFLWLPAHLGSFWKQVCLDQGEQTPHWTEHPGAAPVILWRFSGILVRTQFTPVAFRSSTSPQSGPGFKSVGCSLLVKWIWTLKWYFLFWFPGHCCCPGKKSRGWALHFEGLQVSLH